MSHPPVVLSVVPADPARAVVWPPPPHDPRDRVAVSSLGAWEVRVFPRGGRFDAYFADHGMAHAQLWHPAAGVSVLTPSRLTRGRYEAYPVESWKFATRRYPALRAAVARAHGVAPPEPVMMAAVERWFVRLRDAARGEG